MHRTRVYCVGHFVVGVASAGKKAHCRIEPNSGIAPVEGNITFTQEVRNIYCP